MILYTNGCSFTDSPDFVEGHHRDSWPYWLAQTAGIEYVNDARGVGSNDRIVRTTLEWLGYNQTREPLFLIQLTEATRREFYSFYDGSEEPGSSWSPGNPASIRDDHWIRFKTHAHGWFSNPVEKNFLKTYENYFMHSEESAIRMAIQIVTLQNAFEQAKVPYWFLVTNYSDGTIPYGSVRSGIEKLIKWSRWLTVPDYLAVPSYCRDAGHLNRDGHKALADYVYQWLKIRGEAK